MFDKLKYMSIFVPSDSNNAHTYGSDKFNNLIFITMNEIINMMSVQANELVKSNVVKSMLNECATDEERCMKLAIASMWSLVKANC